MAPAFLRSAVQARLHPCVDLVIEDPKHSTSNIQKEILDVTS